MATVTGITADKAAEIENASVVSGSVAANGHLILQKHGGETIDAGLVRPNSIVGGSVDSSGNLIFELADGSTESAGAVIVKSIAVTFNASGTFTKGSYPTATLFEVETWGGGGGGAIGQNSYEGGGGGGGGYQKLSFLPSELPSSLSVTVGAGGAGQTTAGQTPTLGGSSYVSGFADGRTYGAGGGGGARGTNGSYASGGAGGGYNAYAGPEPGQQGQTTAASIGGGAYEIYAIEQLVNLLLHTGGRGGYFSTATLYSPHASRHGGGGGNADGSSGLIGGSVFGGGGGAKGRSTAGTTPGGTSLHGGNGGSSAGLVTGGNGSVPGGGGAGGGKIASGTANGGAGGAGRVVITVRFD